MTISWTLLRPENVLQASTVLLRCHRFLGNSKDWRMSISLSKQEGRVDHLQGTSSVAAGR